MTEATKLTRDRRGQINFCPSWRGYFRSLSPEKQEELRKKYDFWKYQS